MRVVFTCLREREREIKCVCVCMCVCVCPLTYFVSSNEKEGNPKVGVGRIMGLREHEKKWRVA